MKKKNCLVAFLLVGFASLFAGQPGNNLTQVKTVTKLDLRTLKRLQSGNISDGDIMLLVKGDLKKIEALTNKLGGHYKYGYNDISSINLPEKNLVAFSSAMEVEKIQNPNSKGVCLMDSARMRNNIDSVQLGFSPLSMGLTGKGIIVGIIDGGIYFQHPDFKNPDGTTRIKYIWDQTVANGSNVPLPYNYGNQWDWLDINSGNCTEVEQYEGNCADYSHGTCVAGIAAGNGTSTDGNPHIAGLYKGVAPESDIIVVNIGSGGCYNNFLQNVSDAVDYIFKKASALGEPCVINTSVGTYYGSHDGIDMTTQTIEALLDQTNGRVLVAAAGNAGNVPYHLKYNIPSPDSAYTFFTFNEGYGYAYFDWWADTADFNNAMFAIGCNDSLGNNLGSTRYLNVLNDFNPPPNQSISITLDLFGPSSLLGIIDLEVTLDDGRYHCEVQISANDHNYLWRLQTTGSGTFDLWASSSVIGGSDMIDSIDGVYIQYPEYKHPDTLETIVSSWQCSDKIITVGNYSNRAGYLDVDSEFIDLTLPANGGEVVGERVYNTSAGPTRDGRLKPDLAATGSTTICTGDLNDIALKLNSSARYKVGLGATDERNGGTSMASPIVAGIAALYLQKRPTAPYNEIRDALIWTTTLDSFTGPVANYIYGNGKVNAFQALTEAPIIYGAMDTGCINYYAPANVDTGGCILKVYGCTDSTAVNYDSTANINNGTCTYASAVQNIAANNFSVSISPNPFSGQAVFRVSGWYNRKGELYIYDELGRQVDQFAITGDKSDYTYQNPGLAKGFYMYSAVAGENNRSIGKFVVE